MTPAQQADKRAWWTRWALATGCAAVLATLADALLLQRARSYFTGGFLAADSLTSFGEGAAFLGGSFLGDFGALGIVTALVLWVAGRHGMTVGAAVAAVCAALVPVGIVDLVEYQLARYLGDAFNLGLMWDLVNGDTGEIVAVSWVHLLWLAGGVALLVGAGLVTFWWLRRRRSPNSVGRPTFVSIVAAPILAVAVAAACTTALRRSSDVMDNGLRRKPSGQWLGVLVNVLSDVDRDGVGVLGRPPDPKLLDPRVRPYALDVPANGIDEDGAAGDLPSAEPLYQENAPPAVTWARRTDVVLIVLESFRADVIGIRAGGRPVTPVIDDLARRGVSARAAYSHNGYTVQARRHIFTGSVADLREGTLVDDFKARGYETAYFSGQDESFGGSAYGVGFERADVSYDARQDRDQRYSTFSTPGSLAVPHELLVQRVAEFLRRRSAAKPLFLYVNFHDTHFPYHHAGIAPLVNDTPLAQAAIAPGRAAELRSTYLNTAANVDRAVGRVLEDVRRHRGSDPGVIVVGDHGESLFDEGFLGHGYALNDAQTRIPLVVANLPVSLVEPVGQADLREAIAAALAAHGSDPTPRIARSASRRVFQYLGTFERPAQIKLTGLDAQITFDFRADRVRVDGGPWVNPAALPAPSTERWRTLVWTWERMMLARAKRHDPPS